MLPNLVVEGGGGVAACGEGFSCPEACSCPRVGRVQCVQEAGRVQSMWEGPCLSGFWARALGSSQLCPGP